jgi:CxxC motif-containing protein
MENRELVCVACPLGCPITVTFDNDGNVATVTGNTCKRGDAYARAELTNPVRSLTTTVKLVGGNLPVVPVKSSKPVPKDKMFECMKLINEASIKAPVKIGDVVIKDILGSGADIVVTNNDSGK